MIPWPEFAGSGIGRVLAAPGEDADAAGPRDVPARCVSAIFHDNAGRLDPAAQDFVAAIHHALHACIWRDP